MDIKPAGLRIGLVQRACSAHRDENLESCVHAVREAAAGGARLVLLEELHNSRYFCQVEDPRRFDLAEPVPGPSTEALGRVAKEMATVVVSSLFERRAAGLYHSTAVVLDADGSIAGMYRKMHIPDDPGYHEKFYFAPGDLGFQPVDTRVGRLGVLICWDQWFPEAARAMALGGADLLLYPAAIGWDPADDEAERQRQLDAWITIQRGHAVANGLTVAVCNRIGQEPDPSGQTPGIRFWGRSFVCGPQGEWLARAGEGDEILFADVSLERSEAVRRIWPFFRDRRVDAYQALSKRFDDS
ncbi:MAG: carbon-nitrogen hydrolase [Pseudomonadota bacterium]